MGSPGRGTARPCRETGCGKTTYSADNWFAHKCDPIAAQKERAAIVAWLRTFGLSVDALHLADRIEKGEHHAE